MANVPPWVMTLLGLVAVVAGYLAEAQGVPPWLSHVAIIIGGVLGALGVRGVVVNAQKPPTPPAP